MVQVILWCTVLTGVLIGVFIACSSVGLAVRKVILIVIVISIWLSDEMKDFAAFNVSSFFSLHHLEKVRFPQALRELLV